MTAGVSKEELFSSRTEETNYSTKATKQNIVVVSRVPAGLEPRTTYFWTFEPDGERPILSAPSSPFGHPPKNEIFLNEQTWSFLFTSVGRMLKMFGITCSGRGLKEWKVCIWCHTRPRATLTFKPSTGKITIASAILALSCFTWVIRWKLVWSTS